MKPSFHRAGLALAGLVTLVVTSSGCVSQRPSRNGVFNENVYIRKAFLTRSATSTETDPGWLLKASVTAVSTPDPLGDIFGIFAGSENGGALVRFVVTQDRLQMISQREITSVDSDARIPETVDAWPAQSVDLQYRINLDGEKTNYYEENQEHDWQVREWVKVSLSKNDLSDIAPLGSYTASLLARCTDTANSSSTLVPDSFVADESNGYLTWKTRITVPLRWDDATCLEAYGKLGDLAAEMGRQTVTFDLKYSLARATPTDQLTYKPLVLEEKDPIRHKYGPIETTYFSRDEDSGMLAARQLVTRFDPEKPIVWYFAEGFPAEYKGVFTDKGGVADQTNALLENAGVKARVSFKEYNFDGVNREYGDVRYSFLRWVTDRDMQSFWAGVTQFVVDPRTGETVSSSISFNDFAIKDYYTQRLDAYLTSIGACADTPTGTPPARTSQSCVDFATDDCNGTAGDGDHADGCETNIAIDGNNCGGCGFVCPSGKCTNGVCDCVATVNSQEEWPDLGACQDGDTVPIVPSTLAANHNGKSSLFGKMQEYLQKPVGTFGPLGPSDFQAKQDDDFFRAYYALMPYYVFADPAMNQFVIPEGGGGVLGPDEIWKMLQKEAEFKATARAIDRGEEPYHSVEGKNGLTEATNFLNKWRELTLNHKDLNYKKQFVRKNMHMDAPGSFSFETIMARDARHCINGKWETKAEWQQHLISTYWSQVIWHEFGHALGLEHNFMASIDEPNYPKYKDGAGREKYGLYASSVMEYNAAPDRVFWNAGWAPYDAGAISWIYANSEKSGDAGTSISGQSSATAPWKDPKGFADDGTTEKQFLFCDERHLLYTPFCRQGDIGRTPSEIMANDIDAYEWQYQWRNFRLYRKIWDNSDYAAEPANQIIDMRRFLSLWAFDWSGGELADSLRRIGIKNPDPNSSDLEYYNQLTNKFNKEVSAANQMVAVFHKAIIQQSAGERPYKTVYDKYYGDVTQQGIILDKLYAMQGWTALWPTDNYDQNQAGSYFASYSGLGDSSYEYVAEDTVNSMIGGQYDVFPYFVPLAVVQFAQDTHDPAFFGRLEVRDWIGGHTFDRLQDFLDFFRDTAVQNNFVDPLGSDCSSFETCLYDPRPLSDTHNEFIGPDDRRWIWAYVADRNVYVAAQKERHTATYVIIRNYTDYVIYQQDDGAFPGGAYNAQLPMKYFLDSFNAFN